jgi:hypothetical protein
MLGGGGPSVKVNPLPIVMPGPIEMPIFSFNLSNNPAKGLVNVSSAISKCIRTLSVWLVILVLANIFSAPDQFADSKRASLYNHKHFYHWIIQ